MKKNYLALAAHKVRNKNLAGEEDNEYYTKYEYVEKFLDNFDLKGCKVYLPCDGEESSFVKYMKKHNIEYRTATEMWGSLENYDWCDVVITNPPFSGVNGYLHFLLNYLHKNFILVVPYSICMGSGIRCFFEAPDPALTLYTGPQFFIRPDGSEKKVFTFWATTFKDFKPRKKVNSVNLGPVQTKKLLDKISHI